MASSSNTKYSNLVRCFGKDIERYIPLVKLILIRNENVEYKFMSVEAFSEVEREQVARHQKDLTRINEIY